MVKTVWSLSKGFTTFELKVIAVISMITDHVGCILFPEVTMLRIIGRLAFPIYSFLLVEGFYNTHSKRKYINRMILFACISEIPFDMAVYNKPFYPGSQNVFFTLAIALVTLTIMNEAKDTLTECVVGFMGLFAATCIRCDYSYYGIFMIYFFYFFRRKKVRCTFWQIYMNGIAIGGVQWAAALAMVPINMYNGRQGTKRYKWLFYAIYPVHLIVLHLIHTIIK